MSDTDKIKKTFASNLKFYMEDYELNQSDISKIAGVSKQSVSYWLNEKLLPRMGVIEKLAEHFHILKSDLLEDKKNIQIDKKEHIHFSSDMFDLDKAYKRIKYEVSDLKKSGIYEDFINNPIRYYEEFDNRKNTIRNYCDSLRSLTLFLNNLRFPTKNDYTYEVRLCEELIYELEFIITSTDDLEWMLENLAKENECIILDTSEKKREYLSLMYDDYVIDNKTDDEINTIYQFLREQEYDKFHKFRETISKKQDD